MPPGHYILDLKETNSERVLLILRAVLESDIPVEKFVFQSWDLFVLETLQAKFPGGRYFYLSSLKRRGLLDPAPIPNQILAHASGLSLEGVSLKGRHFIDREFIGYFQDRGLKVYIWTINNFDRVRYYRDLGVDGVITDDVSGLKKRFHVAARVFRWNLQYCAS